MIVVGLLTLLVGAGVGFKMMSGAAGEEESGGSDVPIAVTHDPGGKGQHQVGVEGGGGGGGGGGGDDGGTSPQVCK